MVVLLERATKLQVAEPMRNVDRLGASGLPTVHSR
jgi:hypothetical protein